MSAEDFDELIKLIGPTTAKKILATFRNAIPVKDRLPISLRYLISAASSV